ncbi:MAG TPA: hypothetical protein VJZ32_07550 [Candidatus Bathyarchaeia archaeon]|nr:hypothetical protein [Candidatus Bathyarchaeia archaeon]
MTKYRVTWKRTYRSAGTPDNPVYVEVFEWAVDNIEQVASLFRAHRSPSLPPGIEIVQIEKI